MMQLAMQNIRITIIAAKNKNKHIKQTKLGNQRATMENSTQETTLST